MKKALFAAMCTCFSVAATEPGECEAIFTWHYENHTWGKETVSGSDLPSTATIRAAIPPLLKKYDCQVMIDAPCGDFYYMRAVDLPVEKYIGIDVVRALIEKNQCLFGNQQRSFMHLDITTQVLPQGDLILCRDCLSHLCNEDVFNALKMIKKSGSKYFLVTCYTKSEHTNLPNGNFPIGTGGWRPIDLRGEPFNFPEPLEIINENSTIENGRFSDKSLFLWKIEDFPDYLNN